MGELSFVPKTLPTTQLSTWQLNIPAHLEVQIVFCKLSAQLDDAVALRARRAGGSFVDSYLGQLINVLIAADSIINLGASSSVIEPVEQSN